MQVVPVKSLSLTLGFNNDGKPIDLQYLASPNRQIFIAPADSACIMSKNMVTGDLQFQEFPFQKYLAWTYVPIQENDEETEPDPVKVFPNDVRGENAGD